MMTGGVVIRTSLVKLGVVWVAFTDNFNQPCSKVHVYVHVCVYRALHVYTTLSHDNHVT